MDHVAILVNDLEVSASWYERVLGLTRYEIEEWSPFPIFMLAGKSGVALFPANAQDAVLDARSKNIKIDHFAFNISTEDFEIAKQNLKEMNIDFNQKNHTYFESIYMRDPDGHNVELTTILVDEDQFYKP